jgi:hypothetical protein
MAKDITPATWFASWSEDGTDITVPIASLGSLTAADADGSTGDVREVLWNILLEAYNHQEGISPSTDQPDQMVIARTDSMSQDDSGLVQTKFTLTFQRRIGTYAIEDE